MTNRQAQITSPAPSRGRVAYDTIGFLLLSSATVWVLWGAETAREFTGAVLGVVASLLVGLVALQGALALSITVTADRRAALEQELEAAGYTVEDGRAWLEREPGSPFYKPGPY